MGPVAVVGAFVVFILGCTKPKTTRRSFFCIPPPPFRLMAIVAITAPAHVRSHTHAFFDLSFAYEQQRQSAFTRTPILGSVETHATPHHSAIRCRVLRRGINDAIGIDTDEGSHAACIRGLEEDWVGFGGV